MINGGATEIDRNRNSASTSSATKTQQIDENRLVRNSIKLANHYAYLYDNFASGTILERQDLVQEGLLGFLQALRRYKPGARTAEMFARQRIQWAIHDAIDLQKAPSRFRECIELSEELDSGYDCQAVDRYTAMQIIAAFELLPDQQRDIMRMIYVDDLANLDVAKMIGVTEGRVSQIHKAAIEKLRKKYGH